MLTDATLLESRAKTGGFLLTFKSNANEAASIFNHNPFINDPPIPAYYVRQFRQKILPELLKRFVYCPQSRCLGAAEQTRSKPAAAVPGDEIVEPFVSGLELCCGCSDPRQTCLITHSERLGIDPANDFFDLTIEAGGGKELSAISAIGVFPNPKDAERRQSQIMIALELEKRRLLNTDPEWSRYPIRDLSISGSFWTALQNADWGELEERYKSQITSALLQIACGRSTSSNLHRMVGQTVTIGTTLHPKWNAYVFQSGASDQDRRCSRIYYASVGSEVHIVEYDPDAH